MTGGAETSSEPPDERNPLPRRAAETWRARAPWLAPIGAVVLATAVVVAVILSGGDGDSTTSPIEKDGHEEASRLSLGGFYGAEVGPAGFTWRWMGGSGSLRIQGDGRYWLGFRALSLRRARRVVALIGRERVGAFKALALRAGGRGTGPSTAQILGPVMVRGTVTAVLRPSPGPAVADPGTRSADAGVRKRHDRRLLSVFLSDFRFSSAPLVALPGAGFYPTEAERDGSPLNWLGSSRGVIDVRAASSRTPAAWLRFWSSAAGRARRVTVTSPGARYSYVAPKRDPSDTEGIGRQVTAGPFPLIRGAVRVTFRSQGRPSRVGKDRRELTVSIDRLQAAASRPRRG